MNTYEYHAWLVWKQTNCLLAVQMIWQNQRRLQRIDDNHP
jgi:hypothetical protein